jgi:hypothetical protein
MSAGTRIDANNIRQGNTLHVSKDGNDFTGLRNSITRPFLTIGAAIAKSQTGDQILVAPGTYAEEGLDISGLSLIGIGNWEHTIIGPLPAASTQNTITVGDQGYLQGFSINVPETAFNAVNCNQASGTNSVYDVAFYGNATTGSLGTAFNRTGGGKTIGANIRVEGGGIDTVLRCDSGVLALEGIHVPSSTGVINTVLLTTVDGSGGFGRTQMVGFNSGNPNVVDCVKTSGGSAGIKPTCLVFTPNIFNATNAVSGDGEYEVINLLGGRIENVTLAVKLDLTATQAGAAESVYRISANHQPDYLYNQNNAVLSEFSLNFTQEKTSVFDASYNIFGAEQFSMGFSERGTNAYIGRGAPYTNGMVVLTTDPITMAIGDDGGNITDVTDEAKSKSGSTFGFQTNTIDETILIGCQRVDLTLDPLKFFGLEIFTLTGSTGGACIAEIWDGISWKEIKTHATSELEGYSYGNTCLERSNSDEFLRLGIERDTAWVAKTIAGFNCKWVRLRLTTPFTTPVAIERFKLLDSAFGISENGVPSSTGLSKFRKTISLNGAIWSGAQGLTKLSDFETQVGTVNNYTHIITESLATSDGPQGDALMIQLPIPTGTCTAFPLKLSMYYQMLNGQAGNITNGCEFRVTVTKLKTSGVLIADPLGGRIPTEREYTASTALLTNTNQTVTDIPLIPDGAVLGVTPYADLEDIIHLEELVDIDISDMYEDDMLALRVRFWSQENQEEFGIWALKLTGVSHQDGKGI